MPTELSKYLDPKVLTQIGKPKMVAAGYSERGHDEDRRQTR